MTEEQKVTNSPQTEDKTDEAVLFNEIEIQGIKVKPWSFGVLFEIAEDLDNVIDKLEERNIDINKINLLDYKTMVRIFAIAGPYVFKIMSKTVSVSEEKLKELDVQDGIKLAMIIVQQNLGQIKNGFGLT